MTVPEEVERSLTWMREGEARFLAQVDGFTEAELRTESALSDWTRAHVVAHVARNAEAVSRLLSWARTGEESLMYPDTETRDRDIETSARQDAQALRADVRATSQRFDADIEGLPAEAWTARLRTFQGREIPATFVVWMRVREVWLHLVDLGSGVLVESWPGDLVDVLLDEVTATMRGRADAPALRLQATDRDRDWQIGDRQVGADARQEQASQQVSGKAADILAWLTGRSTGQGLATDGVLPALPHWM